MRVDVTRLSKTTPGRLRASVTLLVVAAILGSCAIPAVYLRTAPLPADAGAAECTGDALLELPGVNVIEQRTYSISSKRLGLEGDDVPCTHHLTRLRFGADQSNLVVSIAECPNGSGRYSGLLPYSRGISQSDVSSAKSFLQELELTVSADCGLVSLPSNIKEICQNQRVCGAHRPDPKQIQVE